MTTSTRPQPPIGSYLQQLVDRVRERYAGHPDVMELADQTERQVSSLLRQLDEEREIFPSPGVFLSESTRGGRSFRKIAELGELPDPVGYAAFERHHRVIAQAIVAAREERRDLGNGVVLGLSAADMTDRILRAVAEAEGVR